MDVVVYHYPKCDSCRKARKWLQEKGVGVRLIDIVSDPPDVEVLAGLWRRSGLPLKRFFNTAGQSYRQGDFKSRLPSMSEQQQLSALAADGKLIKRPIVDAGERVLVGFKAKEYQESF